MHAGTGVEQQMIRPFYFKKAALMTVRYYFTFWQIRGKFVQSHLHVYIKSACTPLTIMLRMDLLD